MTELKVGDFLQVLEGAKQAKPGAIGRLNDTTHHMFSGQPYYSMQFTNTVARMVEVAYVKRVGSKLFPKKMTNHIGTNA